MKNVCRLKPDDITKIKKAKPWSVVVKEFYQFLHDTKEKCKKEGYDELCMVTFNGDVFDFPLLLREEHDLGEHPEIMIGGKSTRTSIRDIIDSHIDVMAMIKSDFVTIEPTNFKLGEVYEVLVPKDERDDDIKLHSALGDVNATIAIFQNIGENEDMEELRNEFVSLINNAVEDEDEEDNMNAKEEDDNDDDDVIELPFKITQRKKMLASFIDYPHVIIAMYIMMLEYYKGLGELRFTPAKSGLACDGYHVYVKGPSCHTYRRFGIYVCGQIRMAALATSVVNGSYSKMMDSTKTFKTCKGERFRWGKSWVLSIRNHAGHIVCPTYEKLPNDAGSSSGRNAAICIAIGHSIPVDRTVNNGAHEKCNGRLCLDAGKSRYLISMCKCWREEGNVGAKECLYTKFQHLEAEMYAKEKEGTTSILE